MNYDALTSGAKTKTGRKLKLSRTNFLMEEQKKLRATAFKTVHSPSQLVPAKRPLDEGREKQYLPKPSDRGKHTEMEMEDLRAEDFVKFDTDNNADMEVNEAGDETGDNFEDEAEDKEWTGISD